MTPENRYATYSVGGATSANSESNIGNTRENRFEMPLTHPRSMTTFLETMLFERTTWFQLRVHGKEAQGRKGFLKCRAEPGHPSV